VRKFTGAQLREKDQKKILTREEIPIEMLEPLKMAQ